MKRLFFYVLILLVLPVLILYLRYGGGEPYPDKSTAARLPAAALEEVLRYPEPIGNVAVSHDGRVFFTVHPESRPQGNRLLEWRDGAAMPFPDGASQLSLFNTVLGIAIDRQNRLWTIDHGNHGFGKARLLAFDLDSRELVQEHAFARTVAQFGSFLQDLQVDATGRYVFIADVSFLRKNPALVIYDAQQNSARRVLESHPSVYPQDWLIRNQLKDMRFLGGLVTLQPGVDGIAIDTDNQWLYYAAMSHSHLYRVPISALLDSTLSAAALSEQVERYSDKPLNDGLSTDLSGNIFITDVEHQSIVSVGPDRKLQTLIRSDAIRWADALSFGPDGWLYVADSAIPEQILQTTDHIKSQAPYFVFRFKPGTTGIPGQ